MTPQINWSKLMAEINKLADVERLKGEVHRIGKEIRSFDVQAHLSPTAKRRLQEVEKRYQIFTRKLHSTQRQVDREFNRLLRNIKSQRGKAEVAMTQVMKTARDQRKRFEKVSSELKAKVMRGSKRRGAAGKVRTRKKKASA